MRQALCKIVDGGIHAVQVVVVGEPLASTEKKQWPVQREGFWTDSSRVSWSIRIEYEEEKVRK